LRAPATFGKQQIKIMTRHSGWIITIYFLLTFYTFGASMIGSFAMYHTWRFVGENEFITMHMESGQRIVMFFVLPTVVMTIFQILLFWHRPKIVPKTLVWVSLVCCMIPWFSSAFIQIPIQLKLDQGKDSALLEWLILSDWIRVIPDFGLAISAFIMLNIIVREACVTNSDEATTKSASLQNSGVHDYSAR
jgi:hypothetical protein